MCDAVRLAVSSLSWMSPDSVHCTCTSSSGGAPCRPSISVCGWIPRRNASSFFLTPPSIDPPSFPHLGELAPAFLHALEARSKVCEHLAAVDPVGKDDAQLRRAC